MSAPPKRSSSAEFQSDALTHKVLNLDVTFHWIAGSDRFWFKKETPEGHEFIVVNASNGKQSLASDAISELVQQCADQIFSPDGRSVVFRNDHDLWLRIVSNGEERRLTHDGEPSFGYGDVDPSY